MFDMQSYQRLMSGGEISLQELFELRNALQKADIGYQTPAGTSGGDAGSLSPLVPQSIEGTLTTLTDSEEEIVFWKDLAKVSTKNTLHEFVRILSHGGDLDPFFGEGGVTGEDASSTDRQSVKVKYMGVKRRVTDVANMAGIIGPDPNAVAFETREGMLQLLRQVEHMLFWADSALNDLQFDGFRKQMTDSASDRVKDLSGKPLTLGRLEEELAEAYSEPFFGRPNTIYVSSQVHADLSNQAQAAGRFSTTREEMRAGNRTYVHGSGKLHILTPYGAEVPVKVMPLLDRSRRTAPLAAAGDTVTGTLDATSISDAVGAGGSFTADEAGDYLYGIVPVGAKGRGAVIKDAAAVAVAAGQKVTLTINDDAQKGGTNPPVYYRIYRSKKNDTGAGAKLYYLADQKAAAEGVDTTFEDLGTNKTFSSPVFACRLDPREIGWAQFLPAMRRPLATLDTSTAFMLMLFGALMLKAPGRCFLLENVGTNVR